MAEVRVTAETYDVDRSVGNVGAVILVLLWILAVIGAVYFFLRFTKRI